MLKIALAAVVAIAFAGASALAQGVAPGGPIGGSTGIGSGLGGVNGTGPSWPNGTNQAPQPTIQSVPPGGYPTPGAPSYSATPSTSRPSTYRQPIEPYAGSASRQPATIPLQVPAHPNGAVAFLKGCWRTENFAYGGHRGTITWCFDDQGGGRYLFTRTDAPNVFFCHAQAQAVWNADKLALRGTKLACDDGTSDAPAELTCRDGTDGALCSVERQPATMRLFRVR